MILGLRIALLSIELGTAIWSHSLSLLAGAGHLFADLLTLGLTFIAAWAIQRQPLEHTTRTEQRLKAGIGLINGISLGAIALLIALEAVKHLQTTEFGSFFTNVAGSRIKPSYKRFRGLLTISTSRPRFESAGSFLTWDCGCDWCVEYAGGG